LSASSLEQALLAKVCSIGLHTLLLERDIQTWLFFGQTCSKSALWAQLVPHFLATIGHFRPLMYFCGGNHNDQHNPISLGSRQ
jgi:hypothetical protein